MKLDEIHVVDVWAHICFHTISSCTTREHNQTPRCRQSLRQFVWCAAPAHGITAERSQTSGQPWRMELAKALYKWMSEFRTRRLIRHWPRYGANYGPMVGPIMAPRAHCGPQGSSVCGLRSSSGTTYAWLRGRVGEKTPREFAHLGPKETQ